MPTVLRTPDDRFANLPNFPFPPHYVEVNGLRMHYLDEGAGTEALLCLHGEPSWSYLYRKMIPPLVEAGYRTIAPDLIGFGRSDKLALESDYSVQLHLDMLQGFIQALDLTNITAVMQDWGGLLGLNLVRLMPERFARLVIMNTGLPTGEEPMPKGFERWKALSQSMEDMPVGNIIDLGTQSYLPQEVIAAYDAPFPDQTYKAAAKVFPLLVPVDPQQPGAAEMKATRQFLRGWERPCLVMFSDKDAVTRGGDQWFRALIPSTQQQPPVVIEGAGHFLQEDAGEVIAEQIIAFIQRSSL
jgi:haloalkane dehalogenase